MLTTFIAILVSTLAVRNTHVNSQLNSSYRTLIIAKENTPQLERIHDRSQSYLDFVQKSAIFVDKTSFLPYMLKIPEKLIFVTCPRGWGKSLNLGTMSDFLRTEYDEVHRPVPYNESRNYRLFVKGEIPLDGKAFDKLQDHLAIADNTDVIDKYLGKYSVIYLNFGNIKGLNNQEVKRDLANAIEDAYRRHFYLTAVLENIKNNTPENGFKYDEVTEDEKLFWQVVYERSLHKLRLPLIIQKLCKILRKYLKRKVYIFIDEYDSPINYVFVNTKFRDKDREQVLLEYDRIMHDTFVDNSYYEKAYITGTFPLDYMFFFLKSKKIIQIVKHYKCLDYELYPFYGFSGRETEHLLRCGDVSEENIGKILKEYSGFTVSSTTTQVFNPRAIRNAITSGEVNRYWWEMEFVERFLSICLRNEEFRKDFIAMIENNGMTLEVDLSVVTNVEMKMLRMILQFDQMQEVTMNNDLILIAFKFLHLCGYLVATRLPEESSETFFLQFPNNDVMKERLANGKF